MFNSVRFIGSLVAAIFLFASFAQADTWRMASKMPADSPEGKVFQYFADKVKEHSGGKLEVVVYPNEQLGKTDAVLEQLKLGTVHLYAEGSTYMKKWVPEINWTSAAFMFDDRDHWIRFMETDLVQGWYKKASDEAGISLSVAGASMITASHPAALIAQATPPPRQACL